MVNSDHDVVQDLHPPKIRSTYISIIETSLKWNEDFKRNYIYIKPYSMVQRLLWVRFCKTLLAWVSTRSNAFQTSSSSGFLIKKAWKTSMASLGSPLTSRPMAPHLSETSRNKAWSRARLRVSSSGIWASKARSCSVTMIPTTLRSWTLQKPFTGSH